MIVLKSNSHRASYKIRNYYGLTQEYYHKNLFEVTAKGGFWIVPEEMAKTILQGKGEKWYELHPIKGITRAKDQNVENYYKCWNV